MFSGKLCESHHGGIRDIQAGRTVVTFPRSRTGPCRFDVFSARGAAGEALAGTTAGPFETTATAVTIRLEHGRSVEGIVLQADGSPANGIKVVALPVKATYRHAHGETHTGKDGRFVVEGLGTGEYHLDIRAPEAACPVEPIAITGGGRVLVVRLETAISASVTVLDDEGNPVSRAQVCALKPGRWRYATTDAAGRGRLTRLAPGREYELRVVPPAGRDDLRSFVRTRWFPEDEESIEIRLPAR